jgi:hypothetical protein
MNGFVRFLTAAAVVATVLALTVPATASTHRRWVENADYWCAAQVQQLKSLPRSDGTLRQLQSVLPTLTAMSSQLRLHLQAVPPPAQDRAKVTSLYRHWANELAADRDAYRRLKTGDVAGFHRAFARIAVESKAEDDLLQSLGTLGCRRA